MSPGKNEYERLPIKVILPHQGAEIRVPGGGPPPRPFREVDASFRAHLSNQIRAIGKAIEHVIPRTGGAPARVRLARKASAKSHRPVNLFSEQTCPIIGSGRLGDLFVKATPEGLRKVDRMIREGRADYLKKEISTIESIEAITPDFRRDGTSSDDILRNSPRKGRGYSVRVQLFDFGSQRGQERLVEDFRNICEGKQITLEQGGYSEEVSIFEATCHTFDDVSELSSIVGVRSVKQMPIIHSVRGRTLNPMQLPSGLPVPSENDRDFPVVAVVDSGVTDQVSELNPWVVRRESSVAPEYRNNNHGSFVAGLICWGKELNPELRGIDENPCGVYDLQVIPNSDPGRGDTDFITESELLQTLETALKQHANEYRVWNLSLGLNEVCSLDRFSPLAVELDNLQEKYKVTFVISAGNYEVLPLLDYPRTKDQIEKGRITSPADSVLGITVASISHISQGQKGPKEGDPSPFSRHGAGPNYVIKPDLAHFGGSCRTDGSNYRGVRSLDGTGTCESLGTSYAAPLVSRILATIHHEIIPSPTAELARAILTHHARDPRSSGRVQDSDVDMLGFGLPSSLPYCLECSPYTSTLVFEDALRPGYFLEWNDFPFPDSLRRNGRFFGDIWMTVAFSPARGSQWGTEYCETHIDASLGVFYRRKSRKTGKTRTEYKGLVPPEHKNPGQLYESFQIAHLRKWAPVRTFFGSLGPKGVRGDRWRLKVRLLSRHGIEEMTLKSQPFALIVTVADPEKTAPVYDEMARKIRSRFRIQNLTIRATTRIRARA